MMSDCPRCGAVIPSSEKGCPACGELPDTPTSSFAPVSAEQGDSPALAEDPDGPVLVVTKGPTPGERFYLDASRITVGRDPQCDIFLNDMTVSRSHALITVFDGGIEVIDQGSLNGTYVNGLCVDSATVSHGDMVQIGTFQMVFVAGAATR